jgi:GAF domain-containing protein
MPMVTVTQTLADRIADVALLLEAEDAPPEVLHRLISLAVDLMPGAAAAAATIASGNGPMTFAASDPRILDLHQLQFSSGQGPAVETLLHNEPRRVDDTAAERRWPGFCRAAQQAGFASCLMLPLRTDRQPAGAMSLYGNRPQTFTGAVHDVAMLFAAQGGPHCTTRPCTGNAVRWLTTFIRRSSRRPSSSRPRECCTPISVSLQRKRSAC